MARRKIQNRNIRSLLKTSGGTCYSITLPVEVIRRWKWQKRQKLELTFDDETQTISIKDWEK